MSFTSATRRMAAFPLSAVIQRCARSAQPVGLQWVRSTALPAMHRTMTTSASAASSDPVANTHAERRSGGSLSPADFYATNVFSGGIPFFSESGMALVRVTPSYFKTTPEGRYISGNGGSLRFTLYAPNSQEPNKYDTDNPLRFTIRGVDVGALLEIDPLQVAEPIALPSVSGRLEVAPSQESEGAADAESAGQEYALCSTGKRLVIRGSNMRSTATKLENENNSTTVVDVHITTGQFRTLQTVLQHVAPTLFGWQALLDPALALKFMDPATLQVLAEENNSKMEANKLEDFFASV